MAKFVCKGTVPYWVDVLSSPPYTISVNDSTLMADATADWLANKLTEDTEEEHWSLEEDIARGANPNSPPPKPF